MNHSAFFFFSMMFLAVFVQGFFALFEMACVSLNKMRLHYLASLGHRRACWLQMLIERPSRLFGTTLIGVTASLQIGSECARRFYESIGWNPDLAPLSQFFLVIFLGELVPLFTARRHPELLAMAFAPVVLIIYRLASPLIWVLDMIAQLVRRSFGKSKGEVSLLSREEVQRAFEEDDPVHNEYSQLIAQAFRLKTVTAVRAMVPLNSLQLLASYATIAQVRRLLMQQYATFVPIYSGSVKNVVAILDVRDILQGDPMKKVLDMAKPAWFVTHDTPVFQILEQFRRNNQAVAVIIDAEGHACGILSLDQVIDVIFGPERHFVLEGESGGLYVERTLSGSLTIERFNREFQSDFPAAPGDTISDFIVEKLGHPPVKGESIQIGSFEFIVVEPTLRGVKSVEVKTTKE